MQEQVEKVNFWHNSQHLEKADILRMQKHKKASHQCKRFLNKCNNPVAIKHEESLSNIANNRIQAIIPQTQITNQSQFSNMLASSPEKEFNDKILGKSAISDKSKIGKIKKKTRFSIEIMQEKKEKEIIQEKIQEQFDRIMIDTIFHKKSIARK